MAATSNFFSSSWSSLHTLRLCLRFLSSVLSPRPLPPVLSYSCTMRNNFGSPRGRGHLLFVHWNRTKHRALQFPAPAIGGLLIAA